MPSANFPQLPKGVWRGVWAILRKTPTRKLDDRALAAELGVQSTAAKAYAKELIKLGILDEDYKPTELANRWRQDGEDKGVIAEILERAYPEDLRDLAPLGDADRDKVIRWFMNDGLGEGSAKNRAATYLMLSDGVNEDASIPSAGGMRKKANADEGSAGRNVKKEKSAKAPSGDAKRESFSPELAVNVQIHISADASSEQIESIFASMAKHFSK
tara:strand:- start:554 stop:1198 length:645 start_codon:yes stop_codon:yes gene_type:complete